MDFLAVCQSVGQNTTQLQSNVQSEVQKRAPSSRPNMITLHKHDISSTINNRYAINTYSFDFENMNDNGSNELKFEITISVDAFISKFEANIDGKLFIGKTKEKETASKEYSEAKEKDENAILISQPFKDIPNLFEIKTNIDSKSKISLTITIEQFIKKQFGFNQLSIQILRNFNKYNIYPYYDYIGFKLDIFDNNAIYNADVQIINDKTMDKLNKHCTINGKIDKTSSMNELILRYKTKGEQDESCILFDHKSSTFCHILSDIITNSRIMNGDDIDEGQNNEMGNILIPRRVMFVIDRSGSMSGGKWRKTIASTITAIQRLRKGYDRFGIILFDSFIQLLPYQDITQCLIADDKNISESTHALQDAIAGGCTNINDALLKAIEMIKTDIIILNDDESVEYNFFMNQIVFITDGEPNSGERDPKRIAMNVQNANDLSKIDKYNKKISIFSFGVGKDGNDSGWIKDLNHSFLKILSVNNNGWYQRIKQTSADTALSQYFSILSKPIISNINIEYENKNINELTKTTFASLYCGNDLIICGKIDKNNNNKLVMSVSGITGKEMKDDNKSIISPINICNKIEIDIDTEINDDNNNNTERIWAYLKLQEFAKHKLVYDDMIEVDDDEKKEEESLPLSLALKYKFVTPWTSMIVVKSKSGDDDNEALNTLNAQVQALKTQIRPPHTPQQQQQQQMSYQYKASYSAPYQPMAQQYSARASYTAPQKYSAHPPSLRSNGGGQVEHKKRTKSLMLLQQDLFVMSVTTVFRNLEDERIWNIDESIRQRFNAKTLYSEALKEDIPWREWNKWVRETIVTYLRQNNIENKTQKMNPNLLQRIRNELNELETNPIPNCSIDVNDNDITIWNISIMGPNNSPFEGGVFNLEIRIPNDYPFLAPKCRFITKIYHCNINQNGDINLDLLGDKWRDNLCVKKVLEAIVRLLTNPNIDDALMPDIAKVYKANKKEYDAIAKEWTQKHAKQCTTQ